MSPYRSLTHSSCDWCLPTTVCAIYSYTPPSPFPGEGGRSLSSGHARAALSHDDVLFIVCGSIKKNKDEDDGEILLTVQRLFDSLYNIRDTVSYMQCTVSLYNSSLYNICKRSVIFTVCTSHRYSSRSYCTIAGWTKRSLFSLGSNDRMPKCSSRFPRCIAYRRMPKDTILSFPLWSKRD